MCADSLFQERKFVLTGLMLRELLGPMTLVLEAGSISVVVTRSVPGLFPSKSQAGPAASFLNASSWERGRSLSLSLRCRPPLSHQKCYHKVSQDMSKQAFRLSLPNFDHATESGH